MMPVFPTGDLSALLGSVPPIILEKRSMTLSFYVKNNLCQEGYFLENYQSSSQERF